MTTNLARLMTVKEVAELINVPAKSVYELVGLRRIPHIKLGCRVRFVHADVLAAR